MRRAVCSTASACRGRSLGLLGTYAEAVAPGIVRADGKIGDLQVLDAMNIETLVEDTMLDNLITLFGRHAAGTQGMPGSLTVSFNPFLDMSNIFLDWFMFRLLAKVQPLDLRRLTWLQRHGPAAVLCWR
jgi:hypothetical protein